MNEHYVLLVGLLALAAVVVVGLVLLRRKKNVEASIRGPGGLRAGIKASDPLGGATGEDIKGRNVRIQDHTGQQATGRKIDARGDVDIDVSGPCCGDDPPKKA